MRALRGLWLLWWCLDLVVCLSHKPDRRPRIRRVTAAITRKFLRAFAGTRARTRAQTASNRTSNLRPNILYIVADDLGWNDVGFHNPAMKTPNIDKLATEGVLLDSFYTPPVCSATRASLLTGRYTHHLGFQHFNPPKAIGGVGAVPLSETLLPKYLKTNGYATHAVGKWHAGMIKEAYLPTRRGFDSFFGFHEGGIDYYKHTIAGRHDLHYAPGPGEKDHCIKQFSARKDLEGKGKDFQGVYDLDLFTRRAGKLIDEHDTKDPGKPLFLYLAYHSPHTPNACPEPYYDMYPDIEDQWRRVFCGMVTAMDVAVGVTTKKFKKKFPDNYVILFHSDNGGPTYLRGGAENYPLRGGKLSLYEGGQRVIAFVDSSLIDSNKKPRVEKGLMHVSDVLPTLVHFGPAPSAEAQSEKNLDGMNLWKMISEGETSQRTEIIHSIDPLGNDKLGMYGPQHMGCELCGKYLGKEGPCQLSAAIRQGKWKLIVGMYAQCITSASPNYTRACGHFRHSVGDFENEVAAGEMGQISNFGASEFHEEFKNTFGPNSLTTHVALFNIEEDPHEKTNVALKIEGEENREYVNKGKVHEMLERILEVKHNKQWMDPQWPPYKTCDTPGSSCNYRPDWYLEAEKKAGCTGPYVPNYEIGPIHGAQVASIGAANFTLPPEVEELLDDFME